MFAFWIAIRPVHQQMKTPVPPQMPPSIDILRVARRSQTEGTNRTRSDIAAWTPKAHENLSPFSSTWDGWLYQVTQCIMNEMQLTTDALE